MIRIGFVDYYLDEWHANNYPAWIAEASGGEMQVTCAWAQLPHPVTGMTPAQWCEQYGVEHCESLEELIQKSDCLVVLSPDDCQMHEELSKLPLASGKPTYVDKTFSPDLASGRRIFAMAQAGNTPCWSSSALRFAAEYAPVDRDGIVAASFWGPGNYETYAIHQLEPLMMLVDTPAVQVMYLPGEDWYQLNVRFADGRSGSISGYAKGSPWLANFAGREKNTCIRVESDFFRAFIRELVEFFRTGKVCVSPEQTLRIMAVREAGLRAQSCPGQWVDVEAV